MLRRKHYTCTAVHHAAHCTFNKYGLDVCGAAQPRCSVSFRAQQADAPMHLCVHTSAGAAHGQELPPSRMDALICAAGRTPRQRTTLYGVPPPEQAARSRGDAALQPLAPLVTAPGAAGSLLTAKASTM